MGNRYFLAYLPLFLFQDLDLRQKVNYRFLHQDYKVQQLLPLQDLNILYLPFFHLLDLLF